MPLAIPASPDSPQNSGQSADTKPYKTSSYTYTPPSRRKPDPDRPWRDIPLSEFPASWRVGLTAEENGGPPEADWICGPCVCTSISTDLERSNFNALWTRLCALPRPDMAVPPSDWAIIWATHWSAGEMEFVFVRPGSDAHKLCDQIRGELAQFPNLMVVRETKEG